MLEKLSAELPVLSVGRLQSQGNTQASTTENSARYSCPSCVKQLSKAEYFDTGVCSKCHAIRTTREMSERLGGRRAYEDFTAERFKPSEATQPALDACTAFNPGSDNIYLYGPTGTGKSHLATVAARKYRDPLVTKPVNIIRRIRACESAEGERDVILRCAGEKVLLIDDLGVGRDTEFAVTTIYEIIDGRYQAKSGGLIVTSNLSLDALAQKLGDDRIPSRLAQMCRVFSLTGKDHRLEGRSK